MSVTNSNNYKTQLFKDNLLSRIRGLDQVLLFFDLFTGIRRNATIGLNVIDRSHNQLNLFKITNLNSKYL